MSPSCVPNFADLLRSAEHTAVHLEMRDSYGIRDEEGGFTEFLRTGRADPDPDSAHWRGWIPLVRETVARGVRIRRARIVSEPVTDYIRWEHAQTSMNISVGEQVRWLPRRLASDIAVPGNDLWLIDGRRVVFHWFTGDGDWAGHERTEDPDIVRMAAAAFEAVWDRGIDHAKFAV
ncbi:hypothetical protein SRB5_46400 [Streptomyces sp. RB5]|uniref:DUF6879 domain-containing protein n=1 Tax=Streptomyces smaragdinus TaxID=2585196 RepID=A0A7K0CMH8_9ACTN|nr:DUF6879 family protein [Streptomyces smaragdinus]MQY14473.1 hypothetical protein [Streptomyces smaragdinus]